jgi:CheY-like chemotaxis protein
MVGVLGFADILLDELTEPSHIEMVSTIKNSGMRLISTLDSILDLSRIEANKQDLNTSYVNLIEILNEVIKLYNPLIKRKKIFLKSDFPEKKVYLNSDKNLLHKIFNNLIDNAVKYTHQGGIIVKLFVQDRESDKKIFVEITDTGVGIPKEFHKIIFEPFRQVSEGFSRKYEGTGLGLSITKRLIELLSGSITLKSDPGKGSTFIVIFPYTNIVQEINTHAENILVKNEVTNKPFDKLNVLLVEDDLGNAGVISAYLQDYFNIDHVTNGQAAVKICSSIKYNAVLMDINLKGIDGVETLKQIRKLNDHYSNIPVIAITAYAMLGDKEKFLSFGFTHYLSKPFTKADLVVTINKALQNPELPS